MLTRNKQEISCLTRRDFIHRIAATGLLYSGAIAFDHKAMNIAHAASTPGVGIEAWLEEQHNIIQHSAVSNLPVKHHVLPAGIRKNNRFLNDTDSSPLDIYLGLTPFVEMRALIDADIIEPWDKYMPKDVIDDIVPAIREECSIDGRLYNWPFLVDVHGMAWNSRIINDAGLPAPAATWEEYIEDATQLVELTTVPYGATFDPHGWRSLAPFAHSLTPALYTDSGLFDFSSEAAMEALILMKKLRQLSHPDIFHHGASGPQLIGTPDEVAFATQQIGFYTKYLSAPIRMSRHWDHPTDLRVAPSPKFSTNDGSSLFWTTGAALLKQGKNKEAAAEYMRDLTFDQSVWQNSLNASNGNRTGQLPPYMSMYADWQKSKPDWLPDFVMLMRDELQSASSIPNHRLSMQQFIVGQPIWEKFLSGTESSAKSALAQVADTVSSLKL